MELGFESTFKDLYAREGLALLDQAFVNGLATNNAALHNRLVSARATPDALPEKEHSQLIIDLAAPFEDFIAELFNIRGQVTALKEKHFALSPLYSCKRLFVQRKAAKSVKPEEAAKLDGEALAKQLSGLWGAHATNEDNTDAFELSFARHVMHWLDAPESHEAPLLAATQYAAWALYSEDGKAKHAQGILFKAPRKTDPNNLIALKTELRDGVTVLKIPHRHHRQRDGFALTDDGGTLTQALDQANYCIWCHNQKKDSCSKGFKIQDSGFKETSPESRILNPDPFKQNTLGITLAGCPLEEKISEMNFLKSEGIPVGALATVIIDNPMCAGTGHRICNDCMKSCIYQKQEPVNIPQAETRTLRDVLELPYGFEIYSLLTRWNPLNIHRPLPKPDTGKKVLVAGLGPAGYTLAHHLMNDGHTVVGIDGLKIEPLPESISGVTALGERVPFEPIRDIGQLFEKLDERTLAGFGGVAEYGITVRWDKNFLKVIRLLLERRAHFAMHGGVRFGSTITIKAAWELGFDHIALCMGAGSPTVINMENGLARGVRAASDFLMALQLTGAAKRDSIANLQLRLPVVVVGGGLTAIDTATESLAYYPVQVEKFLARYEALCKLKGRQAVEAKWSEEEKIIAEEFLVHARVIRTELQKPTPDVGALLDSWGGVKLVYRRKLIDAPSYRLNHEEVEKALEEGITIAESLEPERVDVDRFGHAESITFRHTGNANPPVTLRARAILIAAGTAPNTMLAREAPEEVHLHGKYFRAIDEDGNPVTPENLAKPAIPQVLMSLEPDGRAISFFGDLHPSFAGNVVKAMGSAKQGYPVVSRILEKRTQASSLTLPLQGEALFDALPLQGGGLGGGQVSSAQFRTTTPQITDHARELRKNTTDAEKKLWHYLSHHQLHDLHFRRQHPIGHYIADFACTKIKLVIELDGGQHSTQENYDAARTQFLEQQGYKVLRFWNNEVMENIEGVYARIEETIANLPPTQPSPFQGEGFKESSEKFLRFIGSELRATVHDVIRLTPTIVEVVVKAPLAARMFEPGQFYRLQNYEANALKIGGTAEIVTSMPYAWRSSTATISLEGERSGGDTSPPAAGTAAIIKTTLSMEGLAMTGARADKEKGLLSTIVLEMGGSSDLCAYLQKGEPVVLMGPTGEATHIPENKTLLLVGGGLGNAVLFSIGQTARAQGGKVLYFAGYRNHVDRYKIHEIEAAADAVVWCCDEAADFKPARPQDRFFHGNIVDAMAAYGQGKLGDQAIALNEADHIIAIGSAGMMQAVGKARHGILKPYLKAGHTAIASINSPMQCMMKEICAQCLQKQVDPATGAVTYIYSCATQDQNLDTVSFPFLGERLKQNGVQEKLTAQWIDKCLIDLKMRTKVA